MSGTDLVVFQQTAQRLGASLLPDNAQWEMRMKIRSASSSRFYTVARRKSDRSWGCNCLGWKRYRHCTHLDTIVPQLESALRTATPAAAAKAQAIPAPAVNQEEVQRAVRAVLAAKSALMTAERLVREAQQQRDAATIALREAEAAYAQARKQV